MRVMCIDDSASNSIYPKGWNPLEFGETYNAHQCPDYKDNYELEEIPCTPWGLPVSFAKKRFVPLSDIDEKVLVNQELETA